MYHIDGIFDMNMITFSSVSKYYRGCLEFQNSMPLFSYILGESSDLKCKILKISESLLKMMFNGIVSSFHLEVIVDREGNIFLCEIASRTGGSLLGKTIEAKYGIFLNEYSVKRQMGFSVDYTISTISDEFGFLILPPKKGEISHFIHQEEIFSYFEYLENDIVVGAKYNKGMDSVDSILSGIIKAKNEADLINKFEQCSKMIEESLKYEKEGSES